MVEKVLDILGEYAGSYGYFIAFFFSLVENSIFIGIFVPGGIVALLLGFFAAQGRLDPFVLIAYLFLGTLIGNNLGYYLGCRFGRRLIKRIGKRFSFEEEHFKYAEDYYHKHGSKTLIWGRFIAMIGPFIPFTAGISKMKYRQFVIYDFVGAFLWSIWLTSLGYFFGANWKKIAGYLGDFGIILLLLFTILIYLYIRGQKNETKN